MTRKKMSQREAASWKRRALYAERLVDPVPMTPGATFTVAEWTITEAMEREMKAARAFGARVRVEQSGRKFEIKMYLDPNAPTNDA